jgi:Beta/Gamma crystallin
MEISKIAKWGAGIALGMSAVLAAAQNPPGYQAPPRQRPPQDKVAVILCQNDNFKGWCEERLLGDVAYIGDSHNDKVSSIRVRQGTWEFFKDVNYGGGEPIRVGPGDYGSVEALGREQGRGEGWNDAITSFRPVK